MGQNGLNRGRAKQPESGFHEIVHDILLFRETSTDEVQGARS